MIGIVRGLITVALLILFVMLVAWAWSGRRKQLFDSMARMPLEEDADPAPPQPVSKLP
jgi:cytochrome c oxidase cbb3-type subunit 4